MPADWSLAVREAVVPALRADAALTALVPAERIYGPRTPANPTWPFVRYGTASTTPDVADCYAGNSIAVSVHAFGRGPDESEASRMVDEMVRVLHGAELALAGARAVVEWEGTRIFPDADEADAWHANVQLSIEVEPA